MRHFLSVFVLALASSLASPAATVSHSQSAAHPRKYTSQPATYHGHPAGHGHRAKHAAGHRARTEQAVKVPVHGSRRHEAALATEPTNVRATIPPVQMQSARLIPPMVGSHESLVRQNERTEADGIERIEDDSQLNQLRREKALVAVPVSTSLRINEGLPVNRRYCRPWTARFLTDLARAHYARFHRYLQVNSAVRTVEYQRQLVEVNGNAAPADGDIASPHLSGATIDIAKKGLSISEVAWMRGYLLPLQAVGKLDVEEEFYQSCFHITVYKSYAPPAKPKTPVRHSSATLLASRVR